MPVMMTVATTVMSLGDIVTMENVSALMDSPVRTVKQRVSEVTRAANKPAVEELAAATKTVFLMVLVRMDSVFASLVTNVQLAMNTANIVASDIRVTTILNVALHLQTQLVCD